MAIVLGLDIDPHTVRAVVLKTTLRNSQITHYLSADVGEGPPEERLERVRGALALVLNRVGQPPDRVITELSGDEVSVRSTSLPTKAIKKLNELLPFELEGKVPFDIAESVIDHQPIETTAVEVKMLASVVPRRCIETHLREMRLLGVEPREVAIGAVALDGLVALIPDLQTPGPHCLIDVHPEGTDVCILRNGTCHFARTISLGIHDIDQGRQERLGRELRQTLAAWRMEGGPPPDRFYVCGAMAVREGADSWLGQLVGAPVEKLALPPAPGTDDAGRPAFARAAALAGRVLTRGKHLDARQGDFAATRAANAVRQHLPLLMACGTSVLLAFLFSSYARYSVLDERHAQLEDELGRVTEAYFGAEARNPDQALRLLAGGARGADPMPQFDAYAALSEISASIPDTVTHDVRQLQIDLGDGEETGRFSIRGAVNSVSDTDTIMRALESHRLVRQEGSTETRLVCFRNLELGNTTTTADDRRSYRLDGTIHCLPEGQDPDAEEGSSRRGRRT